jgi:hypothetical protein
VEGGEGGDKSYEGEKTWSSINNSIFSDLSNLCTMYSMCFIEENNVCEPLTFVLIIFPQVRFPTEAKKEGVSRLVKTKDTQLNQFLCCIFPGKL